MPFSLSHDFPIFAIYLNLQYICLIFLIKSILNLMENMLLFNVNIASLYNQKITFRKLFTRDKNYFE